MLSYKKREKGRKMRWKYEEEGEEYGDSGRKGHGHGKALSPRGFTATLTML